MATTTALPTYGAIYAFGDSLSDAGNLSIVTQAAEPVSPPYYLQNYGTLSAAVFSNGPTWVQNLALALNLGTLAPSFAGGNDFAVGGAETGATPQNAANTQIQAISLPAQLARFAANVAHPAANALYTISIGANDVLAILGATGLTAQQQATDVADAVANELGFVASLAAAGAKNLIVMNVPDLGKTPDVTSGAVNGSFLPSAALDATASSLASTYNAELSSGLASLAGADSLNVHILDAYHLVDNAVASPSAFGLTNATTPVWSGTYASATSGTLAATGVAAQDQYLFWDGVHPTETGHLALAAQAEALLSGAVACFAAGTRIATARGDIDVEALRAGDVVRLADGGAAPVTWLGHRRVACRRHARPADVMPVRIAAHAFGLGRPGRDLILSPDHAVFVEDVLIPVRYLLNDATVRQEEVDAVTYWHVELDRHAVLLAEGLPAESYLDTGNRAAFANGGAVVMAQPAFARDRWRHAGCAPLVTAGAAFDLVYRRLIVQALALGWRMRDAGEGRIFWTAPAERAAGAQAKKNAVANNA